MSALYVSSLLRAAEIVGGEEALALRLGVTPSHLALWLNGIETPPANYFLKAVDLISEHEMNELSKIKELSTADDGSNSDPEQTAERRGDGSHGQESERLRRS